MTTTVFFVRHGSHDRLGKMLCGRMPGVGLSEAGRAEAEAVAERLAREDIAALYVSPLQRAGETAEPLARRLGCAPQVDEALNEIDFGDWTGRTFDELAGAAFDDWNRHRATGRPPGGEPAEAVRQRLAGWMAEIARRHPGQAVAAVTHQDVIKTVICDTLGLSLDRHDRFEISPASVSVVCAGDWGARVFSINEVCR